VDEMGSKVLSRENPNFDYKEAGSRCDNSSRKEKY
jgi:hypothetical protein